jgi:hypothetical protein
MRNVLGRGGVSFALLIAVVAGGCFRPASREVRPALPTDPPASSRSDRLREGPARSSPIAETPAPAGPPEPARAPERAEPQEPAPPPDAAPVRGTEPDPLAVIDWLLKQRK